MVNRALTAQIAAGAYDEPPAIQVFLSISSIAAVSCGVLGYQQINGSGRMETFR